MKKVEFVRTSPWSGTVNAMTLEVDPDMLECYNRGEILIQDAFPNLDPDEREFIRTGILPSEWDSMFDEGTLV